MTCSRIIHTRAATAQHWRWWSHIQTRFDFCWDLWERNGKLQCVKTVLPEWWVCLRCQKGDRIWCSKCSHSQSQQPDPGSSLSSSVVTCKVRTDSRTEFGSNPILIDRIRIESAAGSNPILIVQIRTALDRAVDFNECVYNWQSVYTE